MYVVFVSVCVYVLTDSTLAWGTLLHNIMCPSACAVHMHVHVHVSWYYFRALYNFYVRV